MRRRPGSAFLAVLGAAVLVGACGSSTASESPSTGTQANEPSATPAPGGATPAATLIDLSNAANALANVSGYKVTYSGSGTSGPRSLSLTIIHQPIASLDFQEVTGSTTFHVIEIGEDVWVDTGTGTFVKGATPKATIDAMIGAFDPSTFLTTAKETGVLGAIANLGVEQKNGVSAVHLHADSTTPLPAGASPLPAGAVADLWVAVGGSYLVAFEATGFPTASGTSSFQIEVTNVGDPSLTISPPN